MFFTGIKNDFAQQYPSGGEIHLQFNEPGGSGVQFYRYIASLFQYRVRDVGKMHGLAVELALLLAQVNFDVTENLQFMRTFRAKIHR